MADSSEGGRMSIDNQESGMFNDEFLPELFGHGDELNLTEEDMGIADYLHSLDNTAGPAVWGDREEKTSNEAIFSGTDDPTDVAFADGILDKGQFKSNKRLDSSQGPSVHPGSEPSTATDGLMFGDLRYNSIPLQKDAISLVQSGEDPSKNFCARNNCKLASTSYQELLNDPTDGVLVEDGRPMDFSAKGRQAAAQARRAHRQAICRQKNSSRRGADSQPQKGAGRQGQSRLPLNVNIPISLPVSLVGNAPEDHCHGSLVQGMAVPSSTHDVQQQVHAVKLNEKDQEYFAVLQGLRNTIDGLDPKTRVSMRDSLFRLAKSAEVRTGQRFGCVDDFGGNLSQQPPTEVESAIDRTVASLLYHRFGVGDHSNAVYPQLERKVASPCTLPPDAGDAGTRRPAWSDALHCGPAPYQL